MYRKCLLFSLVLLFILPSGGFAAKDVKVPEPLKPWVDWVLHDHREEYNCTPVYNDPGDFKCSWPSSLDLEIDDRTGSFTQSWQVEYESWIQLPGNSRFWPEKVTFNGNPVIILDKEGVPKVRVQPGFYTVKGSFSWNLMPEFLQINPRTALLSLQAKGEKVAFPNLDDNGRIWLHAKRAKDKIVEDSLKLQSFRMIDDRIPARVVLYLKLDVGGSAREVLLGAPFSSEKFIPVSLQSSLPARLEKDGRIRVQVKPGQWNITLTTRHIGVMSSLDFIKPDDMWPGEEVWVFAKQNNRIVEIEGGIAIDPQQTSLPGNWRNYPAYYLKEGEALIFKEIKRGDPVPAPDQLSLLRMLWLHFDGSGYTIQDTISGKKTTGWRLEMTPPIKLGQVAVDGSEQFITMRDNSDNMGIELRKGNINLTADSIYKGGINSIPATGWDHDFKKVSARLFLPPGYKLLHATGIDNIPQTWLNRWTLLDIFIVLIFTIALLKLYSRPLAVIGLLTMVLLYHEPGAPRWIWLAILIGVALVRNVPEGNFLRLVKIYYVVSFLGLILMAIPFSIKQLRVGVYPQLEKPWRVMSSYKQPAANRPVAAPPMEPQIEQGAMREHDLVEEKAKSLAKMEDRAVRAMKRGISSSTSGSKYLKSQVAQYDPSMINQTGPGIPAWQWNSVNMSWSGPVERGQEIGLVMIGPKTNLVLSFTRVALLILLALGILNVAYSKSGGWKLPDPKSFMILPLLIFFFTVPANVRAAEIPSPEMFEQLRERLLEKNECFPSCADIQDMRVKISADELNIDLTVVSEIDTAIPLPGSPRHWLASMVALDDKPAKALYRTRDGLWMMIPEGMHSVSMKGAVPVSSNLQLTLPLKPHLVKVIADDWTVEGIHKDGTIENQLQFSRISLGIDQESQILDTGVLPSFTVIERTLLLGLVWKVETTVRRISPPGSAIIFEYPLLSGEAVVTGGIRVQKGKAQINLDPQRSYLKFESVLEKTGDINLKHSDTRGWTEIWQVDASPIFHVEYEGIPVILHQVGDRWAPKWHPWPGEELKLIVTRPEGVKGQTITVDKSTLEVRPGQRATDAKLELSLRSSQGGQHTIVLPKNGQLQEVSINGRVQSIRQEGPKVPLPISPGKQTIVLKWRENVGIVASYKTPEVDLGLPNANTNLDVYLPQNRWPLFLCGPVIGPAILFWSIVIVIILVAFGLARSGLTHLRFYQWLLLGIGMSQSNLPGALLVVGWLIALEYRRKMKVDPENSSFNLIQLGLGFLTILALMSLIYAISRGLLGHPDMNIAGNGSGRNLLRWYQDYNQGVLPRGWVLSIPMFYFRLAMLAWALWISFSLIGILRYGWTVFSEPVLWNPTQKGNGKSLFSRKKGKAGDEVDLTADMKVEDEGEKES